MRLLSSLTAAASVLADQAADRLDAWVENTAAADEAPRETPLGFTPATGTDAPDPEAIINAAAARGLAGEQRARWLAEVKGRLDVSTGGPWCTEERDKPTGRIMSPYGVIATGVTREADRDLIEDARADLFGLLALAEHDDEVINALKSATRRAEAERAEAERELQAMHHRESAVDMVAAAWVDGSLKGYRYSVDPGEPAGRVRAAIEGITASRGKTIRDLQAQIQAMTRADGELGGMHEREAAVERVLDSLVDGHLKLDEYVDPETPAGRVAELVTTLLTQIRDAENGAQVQHLTDDLTAARETIADLERKLERHHRHDEAELTTADAVRAAAAARIREAADLAEQAIAVTPADGEVDSAAADAFVAGLRAAEQLTIDAEPEADPNVAHIDTVNGRGTLVTGRHGGRAIRYGGGSAGDNPAGHILVTSAGYVRDVVEADDDRHVGAQVKHPDPLTDIEGGTDE